MSHTQVPTPLHAAFSETTLVADSGENRLYDSNPYEYYDAFCDERGKTVGARMHRNLSLAESERQRSMGCERPRVYSYTTEHRFDSRRGQGNGERANQSVSETASV